MVSVLTPPWREKPTRRGDLGHAPTGQLRLTDIHPVVFLHLIGQAVVGDQGWMQAPGFVLGRKVRPAPAVHSPLRVPTLMLQFGEPFEVVTVGVQAGSRSGMRQAGYPPPQIGIDPRARPLVWDVGDYITGVLPECLIPLVPRPGWPVLLV